MMNDTPASPSTASVLEVAQATASVTTTPAREPTLEILYNLYKTPQLAAPASAAHGASASDTPNPVATPFPPRSRSQMGKQCPATAARAHAAGSQGGSRGASITGTRPLSASSASVATAAVPPPARGTLVAPVVPQPTGRPAFPVAARAGRGAEGVEPAGYRG